MRIEFEEKNHIYTVNGDIASISVTELLHKHKLAPSYKGANKEMLKASALKGKAVHKDLENILNVLDYTPTTLQGEQFKKWVAENLDCGVGEQPLAFKMAGLTIAGTADVMGISKSGELIVGDHKNTSTFQREYVSWQVSILDYMARALKGEAVNGKPIKWGGAKKFYCFHYDPKSCDMNVYELEKVDDYEIERLLKAEADNEIYQRKDLVIDNELRDKIISAENYLLNCETYYKAAKTAAEELRKQLLLAMQEQHIKAWESGDKKFVVSYIGEFSKTTVDSRKLKTEYPIVYDKCIKIITQKPSLRVTVREEEDNELY